MKKTLYTICIVWVLLPGFGYAQDSISDKVITWHCISFDDHNEGNSSAIEMKIITDAENITLDQGDYKVNFTITDREWEWEDKGKITYQAEILNSTGTVKFKSKNDRIEIKFNLNGSSGKFQYTIISDNFIYQ